jgi:hypothetical protein
MKFSKTCSIDIFEEAEEARKIMKKYFNCYGDSSDDPAELKQLPSLAELEASVEVSEELATTMEEFQKTLAAKENNSNGGRRRRSGSGDTVASSHRKKQDDYFYENDNDDNQTQDENDDTGGGGAGGDDNEGTDDGSYAKAVNKKKTTRSSRRSNSGNNTSSETVPSFESPESKVLLEGTNTIGFLSSSARMGKSKPYLEIIDAKGQNLTKVQTPSKLRNIIDFPLKFFDKAIINNRFTVSKCPLPIPILNEVVLPGFFTKRGINYRRNAIYRTRAYTYYINKFKPLLFTEIITAVNIYSSGNGHNSRGGGGNGKGTREFSDSPDKLINGGIGNNGIMSSSGKGKKKENSNNGGGINSNSSKENYYRFSQISLCNLSSKELNSLPIEEFFTSSASTSASSFVLNNQKPLPVRYNGSLLETGCSRYYTGKGLYYARIVNLNSSIFHRENENSEKRKKKLIKELQLINQRTQQLLEPEPEQEKMLEEEEEEETEELEDDGMEARQTAVSEDGSDAETDQMDVVVNETTEEQNQEEYDDVFRVDSDDEE